MLFTSLGWIRYYTNEPNYKLVVEVDQSIADYYKSLIPKWLFVRPQKYPAHISVVRKEIPPNLKKWGAYDGCRIQFYYSNYVYQGRVYYWLNAFCNDLEEMRLELGLPVSSPYTLPPEGFKKCFYITIGNYKS